MAQTTHPKPKAPAARKGEPDESTTTEEQKGALGRAADLSEDVLKSVEAGQRNALEAVRKFVDTVDEALPAFGDRPSHRERVIDAALDMADKLVTTQYDFLRNVVQSAGRATRTPEATKK
ncbi:MAG TPA: hypothetical protein VLR26_04785 [Frankiaceae bacterium]|nr:hypothetical protein [Frankiaceae bacterium]